MLYSNTNRKQSYDLKQQLQQDGEGKAPETDPDWP